MSLNLNSKQGKAKEIQTAPPPLNSDKKLKTLSHGVLLLKRKQWFLTNSELLLLKFLVCTDELGIFPDDDDENDNGDNHHSDDDNDDDN